MVTPALLRKAIARARVKQGMRTAAAKAEIAPFSIAAFCGDHEKQRAFCEDRSHRIHVMTARQSGKSQGDDGILLDSGLTRPNSTNLILGFNGPHIRNNNWEPIWKRLWDRFGGLDSDWHHETTMVTRFPNGARVLFGGTDDTKHIKNLLGGRIEDGVVIVDESQNQPVLDELLDSILPPMLGLNARIVLSGVFPEVPAGRFWRESGWILDEKTGRYVQSKGFRGWSHHNWGRLANTHTPDARAVLARYLENTGLTEDDPQVQRDWFGVPVFDPTATTYRYLRERNGYTATEPEWLHQVYSTGKDSAHDRPLLYAHPMRSADTDGARYGLMACRPVGTTIFSFAIDPGANSDRVSIQGWGWGQGDREVKHVFDWTTPRGAQLTTGQICAMAGLANRMFAGAIISWRYDAGSSQNTIDNLLTDYGLPLILAAKKTDLKGQVDRNNDLLSQGRAKVMIGSALEQDYQRARWDKAALERQQHKWAATWHPDASEAARYALQNYFDAYVAPKEVTILDDPLLQGMLKAGQLRMPGGGGDDRPDYT